MITKRVFDQMVKGYRILMTGKLEETGVPVFTVKKAKAEEEFKKIRLLEEYEEEEKKEEEEEKEKLKKVKAKGLPIPAFRPKIFEFAELEEEEEKLGEIIYPLIPTRPKKGEPVFAYARIVWDPKNHKYVYTVIEPQLSEKLKEVMEKVKDLLEQKLDVDFSKLIKVEAVHYLSKQLDELINYFDFRINEAEQQILRYYIERDFIGLGRIEPFMRDENIEDISCDGIGIPIFIFHRNPKISSVITSVSYKSHEELDSFVTRLVQLCGKSISVSEPLVDGALPDGSRLQATLATDIARRGSNFTIRKFTKTPLTPIHLLGYNTLDIRSMAYLWLLVDNGFSVLVSGGTASGKTTMLNVLSLFIKPDKKIVSIEDTAELQLPHPHWVPTVARTAISGEGLERRGEVDLFDLLRESFRQRPDYIILGEVRGREAYILFQQMATGHPSLATIHAENISKLLDRLTTPPISLPEGLIDSLDVAVFLSRMKYRDNFVRRVTEIVEIIEYDQEKKQTETNTVFKWNPINDSFESFGESFVLRKLVQRTGLTDKEISDELSRRMAVLNWMKQKNILDYQNVNKVLNLYYSYPKRTMAMIMSEL